MIRSLMLILALVWHPAFGHAEPLLYEWSSPQGAELRARLSPGADFWQLAPVFATQETQTFCAVASAVTVLNALPIPRPVDPTYAPYPFFTQHNFFTPELSRRISAKTVLQQGMTREEMVQSLTLHQVAARSLPGNTLTLPQLRDFLRAALEADGQFVLANYFRGTLNQVGGGHWSVLAAYDEQSDRVLILDVAKYKYPPVWVRIETLLASLATLDSTSGQSRGLVVVTTTENSAHPR